MKRIVIISMCVILLIDLSGCGYKDLDKRYFVVAIGVDKVKADKPLYKVTLKLAIPSADITQGSNSFELVSEQGETITEAVRILKSRVDKELDFGHAKVIVFGESVIDEDITSLLYWFVRRRDIQNIAWMAVGEPSAKDVLKVKVKSERIPSNALFLSFDQSGTESAYVLTKFLFQFRRELFNVGINASLPVIKPRGDLFDINQAVIFSNDRKKALTLTKSETRLFNVLQNEIDKVEIKVKQDDLLFMLSTDQVSVHFSIVEPKSKPPYVRVNVKMTGILEEAKQRLSENKLDEYGEIASKISEKRYKTLLKKFQEENVDPLGFGMLYRATHFNNESEQKTWNELYPTIKFDVNVKVKMKSIGLVQ